MNTRSWLRDRVRAITGGNRLAALALTVPVGQIHLDEARFLGDLVAGLSSEGPIVEIGTLFGFSTRVMVLRKSPGRELITVDDYSWNPLGLPADVHRRCTADALAEAVREHNVRIVCRDKADFYADYSDGPPSLVFLDAVHSYEQTRADLAWARRIGASVICAHDYGPAHPGVRQAVDEAGGPKQLVRTLAVV
jgi:predicted O-methyltransferase YrrM